MMSDPISPDPSHEERTDVRSTITECFELQVHASPFDLEDLPGILLNLLFAGGVEASLELLPRPALPRRYVATDADLRRFEECAVILDAERFRQMLEHCANRCLDDLAGASQEAGRYRQGEFASADCLSLEAAAALVNQSPSWLRNQWKRGQFYALTYETVPDEVRFPRWQFKADYSRLLGVIELVPAEVNCWVLHHFLHLGLSQIDGVRPRDIICAPERPLEPLLGLVSNRFEIDHAHCQ